MNVSAINDLHHGRVILGKIISKYQKLNLRGEGHNPKVSDKLQEHSSLDIILFLHNRVQRLQSKYIAEF